MGETVFQGTAATGENNVCGRLSSLLAPLQRLGEQYEWNDPEWKETEQSSTERWYLKMKKTENGKLVMEDENSDKK